MNPFWYKSFFSGIVVDTWVDVMPVERTREEVAFLRQACDIRPGRRLLDAPCGGGRHAVEFAAAGVRVTGLDISADMLAYARRLARERGVEVDWREADMDEWFPDGRFDAVVSLGNAFGYFPAQRMRRFLARVAEKLVAGGRFACDTAMLAESLLVNMPKRVEFESRGTRMEFDSVYDIRASRLDVTCTYRTGEQVDVREFSHWVYTLGEIGRMCDEAGLTIREAYGSIQGEPFAVSSPYAYLVAEKTGR